MMYALIRKTDNKKILLWWSQSPCVIRTLREIDGFRDPEIIAIPPKNMIEFYKTRYSEEIESVLQDGVEYDANEDSVITDEEKQAINHGRLYR